ncbi:glycosyltransferase family 1 protein [Curvibacter sp. RS43]|uniref:glycosyltransferase family 4 protein n=1 Tax=Curvibacter microcysteis TaxID=3026419 RepID=UPI00235F53F4|nr:glycosyltransferase family 1 protein [Curvibacter sp. RS43]MDD0810302.1 glycosyltransferase family 1 protein [Curvibacter sp. RS43]
MTGLQSPPIVVDDFPAQRRSLRVAVVTETYPPEVNGVARTIACVVEGLRERQHEIQLIRPQQTAAESRGEQASDDLRFHEVLMRGLPIPRYPHLRMGLTSKKTLLSLWARRRPDVVHIATEGPMGWSALQAAVQLKLPVCSDFRTNFHAYSQHYGMGWLHKPIMAYLRKFHNLTQCTMTPDPGLRDQLSACGFRDVVLVSRGVDTQLFDPAKRSEALRQSWGLAPDELAVLHVGRLAPEKNLGALLMAFEAIRRVSPRARLVMVGDGPSRKEMQARCPDAILAGMRHGEALAQHYASGDLFVFPSLTETFGNVTLEALASGLPVLAYDYAAAGQWVQDGRTGGLAPLGDLAALVSRASALAADLPALRAMRGPARETALRAGWSQVIDAIETIYQGLDPHLAPTQPRNTPASRTRLAT